MFGAFCWADLFVSAIGSRQVLFTVINCCLGGGFSPESVCKVPVKCGILIVSLSESVPVCERHAHTSCRGVSQHVHCRRGSLCFVKQRTLLLCLFFCLCLCFPLILCQLHLREAQWMARDTDFQQHKSGIISQVWKRW